MRYQELLNQLQNHRPFDATEARHLADTLAFVSANSHNFWRRNTVEGHVTASAFVVNKEHSEALMLHHAALNKWLQPGGHVDDTDQSPLLAAIREVLEETGSHAEPSSDVNAATIETLYDVDVHPIPARAKNGIAEPAHLHYDLRYLLVAPQSDVTLSDESFAFRWVPIEQLADGRAESGITRMAKKILKV